MIRQAEKIVKQNKFILEVRNLRVCIRRDEATYRPLTGVNFQLEYGKSVGIVGESGCGKTMTAYSLLRILPPGGRIEAGEILFTKADGNTVDIADFDDRAREMRKIRGGEISMVFQEPMSAFSPVHTIYDQISEAVRLHTNIPRSRTRQRVVELLKLVGMPDPETWVDRYPFQFSGGMRQRAMIAMALASEPRMLIADEPTTALDVTIQARVLGLIKNLQERLNLSLLLITHDLGVIAHMVDYVYIMYLGRVVEAGSVDQIFDHPLHPYTVDLLNSIPHLEGPRKRLSFIKGSVPDTSDIPAGCGFYPRCRKTAGDICGVAAPPEVEIHNGHYVSCYNYTDEKDAKARHA